MILYSDPDLNWVQTHAYGILGAGLISLLDFSWISHRLYKTVRINCAKNQQRDKTYFYGINPMHGAVRDFLP